MKKDGSTLDQQQKGIGEFESVNSRKPTFSAVTSSQTKHVIDGSMFGEDRNPKVRVRAKAKAQVRVRAKVRVRARAKDRVAVAITNPNPNLSPNPNPNPNRNPPIMNRRRVTLPSAWSLVSDGGEDQGAEEVTVGVYAKRESCFVSFGKAVSRRSRLSFQRDTSISH